MALGLDVVIEQEQIVRPREERCKPRPHVLGDLHGVTVGGQNRLETFPGVALSLDHEDIRRNVEPPGQSTSNQRARSPASCGEGQVVESVGLPGRGNPSSRLTVQKLRRTTYAVALLGRAGDVVGQRASLAGEIRRALVVPLIQGAPSLIEEILCGPQGFLLGRLHLPALELAEDSRDIADALLRALEQAMLLLGRHLWPERLRRAGFRRGGCGRQRRGGRSGRRGRGGFFDDRLGPTTAGQEQQRQGGKKNVSRHAFTLPDATGRVRTITVPRSTSDSTSIRPSCICTIR